MWGADGFGGVRVAWLGDAELWLVALVLGVCLSAILWAFSDDERQPPFFRVSVIFAFGMSVVWLDLIANEVSLSMYKTSEARNATCEGETSSVHFVMSLRS